MGDSPHTKFVIHAGDAHATALEAAAAFLALQMRQARGWLNKNRPEFTRANLRWWYNIGFPAAKLDQTHLSRYYNTCVAAAIKALHFDGPLSVTLMRRLVSETNAAELTSLNGALVPEVAAAVASFAKSFRRETGLYVMVDVGASTLDCCTFSLSSQNGFPKCPIFLADVSLRGVQPWECCEGDDPLKTAFEQDVRNRKRGVIWHTKSRRDPMSNRWREGLPVFLIGGGSSANMYQKAVASLDPWLRTYIRSSNGVRLIHLTEPENVEYQCPTVSVHRLAVGIGLSYHTLDIDEIVLPRDIEDISRLPVREYEDIYGK
jgi:hypothetical protein